MKKPRNDAALLVANSYILTTLISLILGIARAGLGVDIPMSLIYLPVYSPFIIFAIMYVIEFANKVNDSNNKDNDNNN